MGSSFFTSIKMKCSKAKKKVLVLHLSFTAPVGQMLWIWSFTTNPNHFFREKLGLWIVAKTQD